MIVKVIVFFISIMPFMLYANIQNAHKNFVHFEYPIYQSFNDISKNKHLLDGNEYILKYTGKELYNGIEIELEGHGETEFIVHNMMSSNKKNVLMHTHEYSNNITILQSIDPHNKNKLLAKPIERKYMRMQDNRIILDSRLQKGKYFIVFNQIDKQTDYQLKVNVPLSPYTLISYIDILAQQNTIAVYVDITNIDNIDTVSFKYRTRDDKYVSLESEEVYDKNWHIIHFSNDMIENMKHPNILDLKLEAHAYSSDNQMIYRYQKIAHSFAYDNSVIDNIKKTYHEPISTHQIKSIDFNLNNSVEGRYEIRALLTGLNTQGQEVAFYVLNSAVWIDDNNKTIRLCLPEKVLKNTQLAPPFQLKDIQLKNQSLLLPLQTIDTYFLH